MELTSLSLAEAAQLVRARKVSPVELTQECLARIERLGPKLNAFITVTEESALSQARAAEAEIARGEWKGPLHGVPIALKDNIETAGVRTTAGSAILNHFVPAQDAEVARRLRAEGAVILGKTNMHEFAYGGSSSISYFGAVRNPWGDSRTGERSPGGSSGGSAAAVAARLCYAAIGTDTGGSVRQPAAYCGIVGLKPTYGRVSTAGVIPLAWSLDHVGPLTRTVMDAALVLQTIAGYDPDDPASTPIAVPDYAAGIIPSTLSLRLGILRAFFYDEAHPEIAAAMEEALRVLKKLTREQREVPPLASDATYTSVTRPYSTVLTAEAYEYHRENVAKSPDAYQPATLKRLRAGAEITPAAYMESRRRLEQIRHAMVDVFAEVDLLITPAITVPPYTTAELTDPESARGKELQMLRNTRPINMLGLPAISVPCGFTGDGLPIGMQIIGPPDGEEIVLRLAHAYEQATEWHKHGPNSQY
jgi:aspartyl-tRNA(Asn)/glutamyl-tRNA(Gln) amidotransferase subunit A